MIVAMKRHHFRVPVCVRTNLSIMSNVLLPTSRLYCLDAIRGLAAVSVVFWHWQNFFYKGTAAPSIDISNLPLYPIFFIFYECGYMAVDFFFVLSGFIFFEFYSSHIAAKRIGLREFFVLRFSRLYPLHIATLLIVLAEQAYIHYASGAYFVYANNDFYHFVLNIFLASNWGLQHGYSFNAPIWSVSIEVILYIQFFVICRFKMNSVLGLISMLFIGLIMRSLYAELGRGMVAFFMGGAISYLYLQMRKSAHKEVILKSLAYVVSGLVIVVIFEVRLHMIESTARHLLSSMTAISDISRLINRTQWLFATVILFPLFILWFALLEAENRFNSPPRWLVILGDISYSSYLLHFPLQLIAVIAIISLGFGQILFLSPLAIILFLIILLQLSYVSYRSFERPAQKWLRHALLTTDTNNKNG